MHTGNKQERGLSLLGGFCFFLSAVEFLIPKPLPFIRLGLANLPLLIAIDIMPFPSFLLLAAIKIAGQALISGTLFSYIFVFSLGGTGASTLLMYALRRGIGKGKISLIGTSAAGALASNGVQLSLAYFIAFGSSVRYVAVPVLALGLITGTLLGMASEYFIGRSLWYARITHPQPGGEEQEGQICLDARSPERSINRSPGNSEKSCITSDNTHQPGKKQAFREARESFIRKTFSPGELAVLGLCMMPAMLLNPDVCGRAIQFLFFWALAWLSGKKTRPLITILVMAGIVFFNLLVPYGEILFSLGPINITLGALKTGIHRAVTLEGLFMLSRACVSPYLALPGAFGGILGESFRVFSRLAEERKTVGGRNWLERIDELLVASLSMPPGCGDSGTGTKKTPGENGKFPDPSRPQGSPYGPKIILAVIAILAWLPFLLAA